MAIEAYENLQIVRGTVAADGTRTAGYGFKVTKISAGTYTLTFNNDFVEKPSVVATLDGDSWSLLDNAHVTGATTERVTVRTGNSDGVVADRPFHFVAMG
ncbi:MULTISPECIES: hypothetical protein [unclassified Streptomyces]|uniref:hypothetical protein n=1 Tax=unclassified Streptomyces TaxID=2593676 RepID=UPI000DAD496A|nr:MULTISPECIES: hypothetical protein [unclassified Streptomyces]PZT71751.1 hypothetical protein DNK55_31960 [Streptomyces sp. AC1-42T]PZT73124.1 hypothetical protein DNK56_33115 [Streptomyces sp. AC1-42W]